MRPKDHTGTKFGRLTAIERIPDAYTSPQGRRLTGYKCICDCGRYTIVGGASLVHGSVRSCGCLQRERDVSVHRLRPYEHLIRGINRQNEKRWPGTKFTYEQLLPFTKEKECHYCSASIAWDEYSTDSGKRTKNSRYNLDRKDNDIGYVPDNCVTCCSRCNYGKGSNFSYDEWKHIGNAIRDYREVTR